MTEKTAMRVGLIVANVAFATLGFGVGVCVLSFWTAATYAVEDLLIDIALRAVVAALIFGTFSTFLMAIAPTLPRRDDGD